jgi:hypothetical protein
MATCDRCHQTLFFNGSDTICTNSTCSRRPMSQEVAYAAGYAEALKDVEKWMRCVPVTTRRDVAMMSDAADALKNGKWKQE